MKTKLIDRLACLRKKRGWTQGQLAKKLKTRQATISDWENGNQAPGGFARAHIASFLARTEATPMTPAIPKGWRRLKVGEKRPKPYKLLGDSEKFYEGQEYGAKITNSDMDEFGPYIAPIRRQTRRHRVSGCPPTPTPGAPLTCRVTARDYERIQR